MLPDDLFVDEAIANLDAMDAHLGRFGTIADPQRVHTVLRHAHSVKGGAAAFGLNAIAELMHLIESVLDGSRQSGAPPDQPTAGLLREAVYAARQLLLDGGQPDAQLTQDLATRLRERAQAPGASLGGRLRRIAIRSQEADIVSAAVTGLFAEIADLGELLSVERGVGDEQVFVVRTGACDRELLDLLAMHVEPGNVAIGAPSGAAMVRSPAADQGADTDAFGGTVRVPTAELGRLVQRARRLMDGSESARRGAGRPDGSADAVPADADLGQWQSDAIALCRGLEKLASAPASALFERVAPVLRRLSARLNKPFDLSLRGGEVRIDRAVLQRLADPLIHLVRNACDHGIELPEQRLAVGKPAAGSVELSAWRESGRIRISVRDDGAGLSRDNLLRAARAHAIPMSVGPDDQDVWQLVFAPGLTTAATISDVSGRGVGMDVVRRQVVGMGGDISITSSAGKGVCVTLSIPVDEALGPDAIG